MKKKIRLSVILFLIAALTLLCAACGESSLGTPVGFNIDDHNLLTWDAVPNARSYALEIKNVSGGHDREDFPRRTQYALDTLEEGDYEIRVRAVGGADNNEYSAWSAVILFHKDHDTGMQYSLINNGTEYEVSRVGTASGDLVIEGTYRNKPVTRIGANAFRSNKKVTSVTLGEDVREIGDMAFYNCESIEKVVMTDNVTSIGISAFQNCISLKEVVLSSRLTQISSAAFAYCHSLTSIDIPDSVTSIGNTAFSHCELLTSVDIPDSVTSIGENAFIASTGIEELTIGANVSFIDKYAFNGLTSLTELTFHTGEDVSLSFGNYAFANCSALPAVSIPEGVTKIPQALFFGCTALDDISIPDSVTQIEEFCFQNTKRFNDQLDGNGFIYVDDWLVQVTDETKASIRTITPEMFREGIVGIADSSFTATNSAGTAYVGCPNLEQVTLPEGLKYLGSTAFYASPILNKFISPEGGVETVGSYAFAYSPVLSNVQFGEGLRQIGNYAFYGCSMLNNNIYYPKALTPDSLQKIGTKAFDETALFETPDDEGIIYAGNWVVGASEDCDMVELKSDVRGIGNYAFQNCTVLESVNGLNRADHIGAGAFYGCESLDRVNFSRNLTAIESYTFEFCSSLFDVTFPSRLRSIGDYAFAYCYTLNSIDLSTTSIETVGEGAFIYCYNVKTLELSDCMKSVGVASFYGCMQVTTLKCPDTLDTIYNGAFARCDYLQKVDFGNGLRRIGSYAFQDTRLNKIDLPDTVTFIGDFAFYGNTQASSVHLGANVSYIGAYAFYGLRRITDLVLPSSVKYIGSFAFRGCTLLKSLILTGAVEYIGDNAFYGCHSLTIYETADRETATLDWGKNWNSSDRPAVWESTLSEDGTYVVSIKTGNVSDPFILFGKIAAPYRAGYEFVGWAESPDAEYPEYAAWELKDLPAGRTLYSVWVESEETEEPEPEIIEPPLGYNPNYFFDLGWLEMADLF